MSHRITHGVWHCGRPLVLPFKPCGRGLVLCWCPAQGRWLILHWGQIARR